MSRVDQGFYSQSDYVALICVTDSASGVCRYFTDDVIVYVTICAVISIVNRRCDCRAYQGITLQLIN